MWDTRGEFDYQSDRHCAKTYNGLDERPDAV